MTTAYNADATVDEILGLCKKTGGLQSAVQENENIVSICTVVNMDCKRHEKEISGKLSFVKSDPRRGLVNLSLLIVCKFVKRQLHSVTEQLLTVSHTLKNAVLRQLPIVVLQS